MVSTLKGRGYSRWEGGGYIGRKVGTTLVGRSEIYLKFGAKDSGFYTRGGLTDVVQ
jgi:hypothetical protein